MSFMRFLGTLAAGAGLGIVALLSNLTTVAQLSGEANTVLAIRSTISKLVNSGSVWGGLAILAGWWSIRWWQAWVAGVGASLVALVTHYGLGQLFGVFDHGIWESNLPWFVLALTLCGPLGVVGVTTHRQDVLGLAAALVLPMGLIVEPILFGMFTELAVIPWPQRVSSAICGAVLIVSGLALGAVVVRHRTAGWSQRAGQSPR